MGQDTNFEKILNELKKINKDYPDIRFGSVVQEAIDIFKKKPNANLYDYSSKVILEALENFHSETTNKRKVK